MTWLPWVPGEATKTFHKVNGCLIGILYSGFLHNPYITWVMLSSPKLYHSKQQSKNFMAAGGIKVMDDDRRRWTLWITKDSLWWWSLLHGSPWPLGPSKRLDVLRTFFFGVENHAHKNGRFCCTASQRHNTNGRILKRLWFFCLKNRCLQTEELWIPRFASRHLPSLTALKQLSTYMDVCVFLWQIFWESCFLDRISLVIRGSKSPKTVGWNVSSKHGPPRSYLINGWNTTDGASLAARTQLSVAYDPAGEGDGGVP